jgi:hypothetical protein
MNNVGNFFIWPALFFDYQNTSSVKNFMKYSRLDHVFQAVGFSFDFIRARNFLPTAAGQNEAANPRVNPMAADSNAVGREI